MSPMDPTAPSVMLAKYGLAPSRDRGQNFLSDPNVARKIVRAVGPAGGDIVVEVGAGFGAITFGLAETAEHVVAVELDAGVVRAFRAEYGDTPGITLIHSDFLAVDLERIREERGGRKLLVAGNLPYNMTSPILERLIDERAHIERAVLMVQAEVGARLGASPGSDDYSALSAVVQYHAGVASLFLVRGTCFTPRPRVDARVVEIDFSRGGARSSDAAVYSDVVHAAFGQRRKMLRRSLARLLDERGVEAEALWKASGIDLARRGETLTVAEFDALAIAIGAPTMREDGGDSR